MKFNCLKLTEVSNQECLLGIGSPFPIDDVVLLVNIETKNVGTLAELGKAAFSVVNGLNPCLGFGIPSFQRILERRQPRVDLKNALKQIS